MKIQAKITLMFVIISTIGLMLLNATIFYFVSEFNFEDFFERLEARVKLAAQIKVDPNGNKAAFQEVRSKYLEKLDGEHDYVIQVNSQNRYNFVRPLDLPDKFYREIITNRKARHQDKNHFYAGSFFNLPSGPYIVIVEASNPYGFRELEQLKRILIIIFVVSILLSYLAGKIFSHYTIRPLGMIIRNIKNITATNLHLRLAESKGKDEIAELALTFNNMLNRLETAFETQNNFVSNASHELRTPLTIITSETELLLANERVTTEAAGSVKTILTEAEKLEQILSSLLGLAQSGFDGKKQNWQLIRVDELVINTTNSVKKIDPKSNIEIDFSALPDDESILYVEGNINLLQLAVSNIVINACKYSNNQPVQIKVNSASDRIIITVVDKGIGIPQNEQQHIFEPFFRASNTTDFEGHGIGLPLTLNIIRLHKGSIGIRSEEKQGTEIQILLPVSKKGNLL